METPISTLSDSKIARRILSVRGLRVMLDRDLAVLFGVSTKQLNQQVLRNRDRFPSDFMFQLTPEDAESLRLQIATSNRRWGGRRYLPYAFTEQGGSTSRSCGRLEGCGRSCRRMRNWRGSWRNCSEDTTTSSGLF
jgi:ORF6N domain-containing protein